MAYNTSCTRIRSSRPLSGRIWAVKFCVRVARHDLVAHLGGALCLLSSLGTAAYQDAIKGGSVVAVTGAANGVGKVAATPFAKAGLSIVTAEADVRAAAANGADAVAHLAEAAFKAGEVALLMNNAFIVRPPFCSSGQKWLLACRTLCASPQNGYNTALRRCAGVVDRGGLENQRFQSVQSSPAALTAVFGGTYAVLVPPDPDLYRGMMRRSVTIPVTKT